jgi:transcriptional regulator GlxA family with amidase domain
VRRAARLIEDHCAEPLGTPDIAESVGVSTRALQAGFRARLGTTPMAYLRRARLARVHDMLMDGSAHSVAEAAHRWGVTHLGRLSGDYRAAFGESPSETLARSH